MKRNVTFLILVVVLVITPKSGAEQRTEFGKQWVRSHPFSLLGWNDHLVGSQYFTFGEDFTGAGLNTNVSYSPLIASVGASAGVPWHARFEGGLLNSLTGSDIGPGGDDYNAAVLTMIDAFLSAQRGLPQSDIGWYVRDEPGNTTAMWKARWMADYLKTTYPQSLVYAVSYPITDAGTGYLNDFVNITQPDVLMYDYYPSRYSGGGTTLINDHLTNVMIVRNKALSVGVPYWAWVQSFDNDTTWRQPGESQLRMQLFSHLTAGYTGLGYFTYSQGGWKEALMNDDGPTSLYYAAADANPEVMNLGRAMRFLTSTDVRFVPGEHEEWSWDWPPGYYTVKNDTPSALSDWGSGAGGDPHITAVSTTGDDESENGLIGFFTDDDGQQYFMLTNLAHNAGTSAAAETVDFTITFDAGAFDEGIIKVFRLNRETGVEEEMVLDGNALHLALPGGTGDLFKYDNGDFVPEPATMALLGVGGCLLGLLKRRRVCTQGLYCVLLVVALVSLPVHAYEPVELFEEIIISRDDTIHESFPRLVTAANGDLVITYQESGGHGLGPISTIVTRISSDLGRTWSDRVVVAQRERVADAGGNWISGEWINDSKITRLHDDSLMMVMDMIPQGVTEHLGATVNYLSRSYDHGRTWSALQETTVRGTVPDIIQLHDGTLLMGATLNAAVRPTYDLYTTAARSTDNGATWSDAVAVVGPVAGKWASEASFVQLDTGEVVSYMRNVGYGNGIKAISEDGGLSWSGPYASSSKYYRAQPGVGLLSTGEVLVTSRTTPDRWFGAYSETQEMALLPNPLGSAPPEGSVTLLIDFEHHPTRRKDYGMGSWVELPDGTVYVAQYMNGDAPEQRTYIIGYLIPHSEFSDIPVPEPATLTLLAAGGCLLGLLKRRR